MSDIAGEVERVLGEHATHGRQPLPRNNADYNLHRTRYDWRCCCGTKIAWNDDESHRAHLAQQIAALVGQHVEAAWDEGFNAGFQIGGEAARREPVTNHQNPYRAGDAASGGGQS